MKISKKRLEEILLEEVKVFVQEKKLEEKTQGAPSPERDPIAYNATVAAHIASLKTDKEKKKALAFAREKGYTPEEGQFGSDTAPSSETEDTWSWDEHEKSAGEKSSWFGELFGALSETNEGCGDMPAPKKTTKIKIKR